MKRLLALAIALAGTASAQETERDVLAGHVTSARGAVANATVIVQVVGPTSGPRTLTGRSDAEGRWLVAVQEGTGDYVVRAIAFGYKPTQVAAKRKELHRPIIVDIRMDVLPALLDTVRVAAQLRPRPPREIMAQDRAGSDRATDGFVGAVAVADQGNLMAMAGTVPGVLALPDGGFSVAGLSADQNRVTINGLSFGATDIPRDAIVTTRVASTTYDVARGGFSGAQLSVSLAPGTNYHTTLAHVTFDSPSLQATDAIGRRLGAPYSNTQVSGAFAGPIRLNQIFYNASFQLGRRRSDLQTLVSDDARTLESVGLGPDSVVRLLAILGARGIPVTTPSVPQDRLTDNGSMLGRLDWFRSPTTVANLTASARRNRGMASMLGPTSLPGHGGEMRTSGADVIGALSTYLPNNYLNDLRLGARIGWTSGQPYVDLPDVRVLVGATADGSASSTMVQAGGNSALPRDTRSWGLEAYDVLSRYSVDRRHRLRATLTLRDEGFTQRQDANRRGTYTFASLADLETNRAAIFTRSLTDRESANSELTAGLAIGDDYRPGDRTQLMYGLRVDANRFARQPAYNADVDARFGLRTDHRPTLVDLSPRIGFFRAFGTNGTSGIPGFGAPWGNVRGGVGLFRNDVSPLVIAPAMLATGLATDRPGQLTCVGAAVPAPDWRAFAASEASIPATCAGSTSSAFATGRPSVFALDRDFAAQRSWRTNLALNAFLIPKVVRFTVEGVYSLNLGQQSAIDLNFDPTRRFSLNDEADRPVYVAASSIVARTGAMTNRDSRHEVGYGSVTALRSDLRGDARQLIVTVFPAPGDALGRFTQWSASYSLQRVRDQARGFGAGGTAGNPLDVAWGRSALDIRHQVVLSLSTRVGTLFSVSTSAHFASGLPFTPMVGGDINGDGAWNDRAFIFAPTDSAHGDAMRSLLDGAPDRIRRCLQRQLGSIAARNSCEGPWTGAMNAVLTLNPERLGWQNRATVSLSMTNVLAGADQLVHGGDRLHGWGQPGASDPNLLTVRGFDASAGRFTYDVNQRFGDTRPSRVGARVPFQLTLEARVQLGRDFTSQAIDQTLSPGRTRKGERVTFAQMKPALLTTVYNPVRGLLQSKDSLTILTREQLRQLTLLDQRVTAEQDSIVTPLAHYLADLPADFDRRDVARRLLDVQNALFATVVAGMRQARAIFTPEQINEFPPLLRASFDIQRLMSTRPTAGFEVVY